MIIYFILGEKNEAGAKGQIGLLTFQKKILLRMNTISWKLQWCLIYLILLLLLYRNRSTPLYDRLLFTLIKCVMGIFNSWNRAENIKICPFFWIEGSRRQSKGQDVDHTNKAQNDKDQTQNTEGTNLLTENFLKLLLL